MGRKEEIEAQYKEICAQAGQLQFKIKESEAMLMQLNEQIFTLQKEFTEINSPKAAVQETTKAHDGMINNQTFKGA